MNYTDMKLLIEIPVNEKTVFDKFVRQKRIELISSPKETAMKATQNNQKHVIQLLNENQISETIILLRELAYQEFLKEEAIFNGEILKSLGEKFKTPKEIIGKISNHLFDLNINNKEEFKENLLQTIGHYTAGISPYIYALCLSNTQSRRSRAGKVFEGIIYFLYDYFKYPFDAQSKIGKQSFSSLGLGKIVDSILPGVAQFNERRDRTIVGTMKTTLRERWQEVVEEVSRSNVPRIYLLTVDDDFSENKIQQMSNHNIILVVTQNVKQTELMKNKRSVIDFETYFVDEIPEIMSFWER